jgi:hypothetical protein
LLAPHYEIAFLFQPLRCLFFCLPGFSRPSLQQGNLLVSGDRIPVDTPARREIARRILCFGRPLAEQFAYRMRDIGEPRRTRALIEHSLDAKLASPGRDVGVVDRTVDGPRCRSTRSYCP